MQNMFSIYRRIAKAQIDGHVCAFVDLGRVFNEADATTCSVRVSELLVSTPDSSEHERDIVETLVRSEGVGLIVSVSEPHWSSHQVGNRRTVKIVENFLI